MVEWLPSAPQSTLSYSHQRPITIMVLSDVDLLAAIEAGQIEVSPAPDYETQLGACSLDLRLGNEFRVFERTRNAFIDPRGQIDWDSFTSVVTVPDDEP